MNVTKIILTRCQIFHLKCTKFYFGARQAHSAPHTPKLDLGKRRKEVGEGESEGEGGRERGKRNGRRREEGKGRREGLEKGGFAPRR